jgi:Fic family protein
MHGLNSFGTRAMPNYHPSFSLNNHILSLVAKISESVGRLSLVLERQQALNIGRVNRVKAIHGSLALEGNSLSEAQISAVLDAKEVMAATKDVQEAINAIDVYDQLSQWQPEQEHHLLAARKMLMMGIEDTSEQYRNSGVGVMSGKKVVLMAPQAARVPQLMRQLFIWLDSADIHPLIASCIVHYELEFIHPFADGNGRIARLWQTLILSKWQNAFAYIPVESLVFQRLEDYKQAIRKSTESGESTPFIEFMLELVLQVIDELIEMPTTQITTHKIERKVAPDVGCQLAGAPVYKPERWTTHKTTLNQQAMLNYISKNPNASRKTIAEAIATITENGVKYNLKVLQKAGLLKRIGASRSGYWQVLS